MTSVSGTSLNPAIAAFPVSPLVATRIIEHVIDAEFTEKTEAKEELPVKTEKVVLPEGTIEFELDEEEHLFDVGEVSLSEGNFTQAEKAGNLSGPSSHSSGSFSGQETSWKRCV